MKITFFLSIVLIVLFANYTFQNGGVLFVNQIWGNSDTLEVQIEDAIIDDNELKIDFIVELGTGGVTVEESNFKDGSVIIPINLDVGEVGTVEGLLNANGGILADADADDIDFSFRVENDSGDTTINGVLHANGGITADNGKFTVSDITGETTIADALLRPDGGIDVQNGRFTVDNVDGNVFTEGELQVALDIILGSNIAETRSLTRQLANSPFGGATHIHGQDAPQRGGDIAIIPGIGPNLGDIIFGRAEPDDLYIGRGIVNGGDAGKTTFFGQDSDNGRGGDIIIASGNSSGGVAGDIILSVGEGSLAGTIFLGSDDNTDSNLLVTRPTASNNAGTTTFAGQDAGNNGNGGDLILEAGDAALAGSGGDLRLIPGDSGSGTAGRIVLGEDRADDLLVTRLAVSSAGASTVYHGQDSLTASGGSFVIEAGDGGVSGGDIYLAPGKSAPNGNPGEIIWGREQADLTVRRDTQTTGSGTTTSIVGQSSINGSGGDLVLLAGAGVDDGGDLTIFAPSNPSTNNGGNIAIRSGNGAIGGDINIFAGSVTSGGSGDGGDVNINAGTGLNGGDNGNIVFQTGAGASGGDIVFGPQAAEVRVELVPLVINNGGVFVTTDGFSVQLSPDNDNILSISNDNTNYRTLLRNPANVQNVQIPPSGAALSPTCDNMLAAQLNSMATSVTQLVKAMSVCGHGLIDVVNAAGDPQPVPDFGDNSGCDAAPVPFIREIARAQSGPKCDESCGTCTGPARTQCTSCTGTNVFVLDPVLMANVCCHPTCATCTGPSEEDCITCAGSNTRTNLVPPTSSCN